MIPYPYFKLLEHRKDSYYSKNADLFLAVAEILVRDYIAPSETADTVAEWCKVRRYRYEFIAMFEPSELAALIADVEGYEKR